MVGRPAAASYAAVVACTMKPGVDAVAELAHVRERVLDLIVELCDRAHTQRHDDQIGGQHALLAGGDGGNGHTGVVHAQDRVAEDTV